MFGVRELNISIELWGVVFCVIGIVCAYFFARADLRYRNLLITMFSLSWELTLVALAALPLVTVLTVFFKTLAKRNNIRVKAQLSRLNGFMSENIVGMKVVQIFHREKEKRAEFKDINDGYYKLGVTEAVLNSLGNTLIPNIAHILALLMMAFYCNQLLEGTILIGVMYSFITYTKQLYQPISAIAQQYTSIASAIVSADRIFDITDKTEFDEDMDSGFRGDRVRGEIEFRNVWFAYVGENWVLISGYNAALNDTILEMVGQKELLADPNRYKNRARLYETMRKAMLDKPSTYWLPLAKEMDIPMTRMNHYADLATDPQAWANGYLEYVDFPSGNTDIMPRSPIEMDSVGQLETKVASHIGADTDSIMLELGYTQDQIDAMRNSGAAK